MEVCARIAVVSFFCLMLASGAASANQALADEQGQECQKIVIAAPPEYPPFSYTYKDVLDGAGVALARMIVEKSGLTPVVRSNASWARVYSAHLRGEIDMVAALYRTTEREKKLNFLGTYAAEKTILVLRKSSPIAFSAWQDLQTFTGVVVNGDSRGDELDQIIADELKVVRVHSFENVEQLLFNGRVDYALVGEFSQKVTAFDYRSPESPLFAHDTAVARGDVYISLTKASNCVGYADIFRSFLKDLIDDGTAEKLLIEHAGLARGNAIKRQ